ncbi:MAG: energy transducer TonB [Cyclobacterium sp.]|uniref:energy transducer TonB n=1 Tax=unclassified Cyclobacterium TaxID=2615055 RepID=UPI0013D83572|nr:energy transducer TonB [Cyclobacterium sp. SYSU L10401]
MEVWEDQREQATTKRKAIIITFIMNVLILTAVYFIVVWKQPVPPMSQFGLELNLGFSDVGTGENQTTTPPSSSEEPATEAAAPGEPAPQPSENAVPTSPPESTPSQNTPQQSQPKVESPSRVPSPIQAEEQLEESIKEPEKTNEKPSESASNEVKEAPAPEKVEEKKPTVDPRAIFGAGGTKGSSRQPAAGSQQGESNQSGDEGNPQGTVDGRSILQSGRGNTGDGSGYNLDLAGWDFASKPNIQDNLSNRNGKIVFRITVNDDGKIVQAIPLEYNVTNEVMNYYRTVVNGLSFKRQSGNPTAEYSTGRITFIIRVD